MEYSVFGKGPKNFVMIPGLSIHSVLLSADAIADAYRMFSDDFTVYVVDPSKDITDSYTVRNMADDIAAFMESKGIADAYVFGASLGGMAAMCLAIRHPELVRKMILGSTLSKPNAEFDILLCEWIRLAESKNETGLIESFADNVYSETTLKTYRDYIVSSNLGISDTEYRNFLILAGAIRNFDCYDELRLIKCPVLVLGAEGDAAITDRCSREIAEALKCDMHIYGKEFGHAVYDEAPDYKQRMLDFFLEK